MTSTSAELFAAIGADDPGRVRAILALDPGLAAARDAHGVSALMQARYRADRALTEAVMAHVNTLDLFEAASFGDLDRITELLAYDPALVDAISGDGFTALHFAAFFGQTEAARLLVNHGADVDAHGRGWMTGTALNSAATAGHIDAARVLLAAGADPDARQSGGWTPLHAAVRRGGADLATMLLVAGADPAAVNDEGRSVLDLARDGADAETCAVVQAALGGDEGG